MICFVWHYSLCFSYGPIIFLCVCGGGGGGEELDGGSEFREGAIEKKQFLKTWLKYSKYKYIFC